MDQNKAEVSFPDSDEDEFSPEDELAEMFDAATIYVEQSVMSGTTIFNDNMKLKLYGLYKQATLGKCNTPKPSMWDLKGKAKWNAWHELGDICKEDAMGMYVAMVRDAAPKWEPEGAGGGPGAQGGRGMGPVFSTLSGVPDDDQLEGASGPCSSLLDAARTGDEGAAASVLELDPISIAQVDEEGCSALHLAADSGAVGVMRRLLEAGADVNQRDSEGQTPLHYGAICEREEVCKLLLEHGADCTIADASGDLPAAVGPASWTLWPA